jgi:hypothetical protein
LRFSGEDLSAISPEWRLEWCADTVQRLEKDRLLCVGDSPVPGVTDEQWEKLRQQVGGQAEGRGVHWTVDCGLQTFSFHIIMGSADSSRSCDSIHSHTSTIHAYNLIYLVFVCEGRQVIGVVQRHRADDSGIKVEAIAKIQDRWADIH